MPHISGVADVNLLYDDELSTIDKVERISDKLFNAGWRRMGPTDEDDRATLRIERVGFPHLHGQDASLRFGEPEVAERTERAHHTDPRTASACRCQAKLVHACR